MTKLFLSQHQYLKTKTADNFWTRLRGLLGTKCLARDEGLLIKPCNSIHMVGMKYAIDVIYLDKQNNIIKIVEGLKPWWGFSICLGAKDALEIVNGGAKYYNLQVGQNLDFRKEKR